MNTQRPSSGCSGHLAALGPKPLALRRKTQRELQCPDISLKNSRNGSAELDWIKRRKPF